MNLDSVYLIDSHAHLCSEQLFPLADDLINEAVSEGVKKIVNICTNPEELEKGILLKQKYPETILLVGCTTPHDAVEEGDLHFPYFESMAKRGVLDGIGETGLEYYGEYYTQPHVQEVQQDLFRRYLNLAKILNLPVTVHCRNAFDDFFKIIDEEFTNRKGILHCFSGSLEDASKLIDRGWMISISGIATFKNNHTFREVISQIPLEHLVIETDAPFLAPQKYRGQVNHPAWVKEVALILSQIKQVPLDRVIEQTCRNTNFIFQLSEV